MRISKRYRMVAHELEKNSAKSRLTGTAKEQKLEGLGFGRLC